MATKLKISKLLPDVDNWSQRADFEAFLELHLSFIINNYIFTRKEVSSNDAVVYKGDFYGLLNFLSIPMESHYIILRVNGFYNSADYDGSPIMVLFPNLEEIDRLKNVFKTNRK